MKPSGAATPTSDIQILFTGRLLGYLGLPQRQDALNQQCPAPEAGSREEQFLKEVGQLATGSSAKASRVAESQSAPLSADPLPQLILGTGDNFAPAFNARWLVNAPNPELQSKDANTWDWIKQKWVTKWDDLDPQVQEDILDGRGFLGTDNVGCFLKAAKYDAVVPGEHDFYFGSERLRYLARFLAQPDAQHHAVQMLGANLVIQTSFRQAPKPMPDSDRDLPFATKYPGLTFKTLKDGKSVLPWLQYFDVAVAALKTKAPATAKPWSPQFKLCLADRNDASNIKTADCSDDLTFVCLNAKHETRPCPTQLSQAEVSDEIDFRVFMPQLHSLQPDNNYAICLLGLPELKPSQKLGFCTRFSVYVPFFQYARPNKVARAQRYVDPQPYLLKSAGSGGENEEVWKGLEVAVFGVVDPNLRSSIGEVNDSWINSNSKYKTEILVLDPAEALYEQLQYFEREYWERHHHRFTGIRILLAQMAPPLARQLAAKLRETFDLNVVISEADAEQSTPNGTVTVRPLQDESSRQGTVNKTPAFVVVPPPYVDSDRSGSKKTVLQIRKLIVSRLDTDHDWQFDISGRRMPDPQPPPATLPIQTIAQSVQGALKRSLEGDLAAQLPSAPQGDALNGELQSLTLFALKKHFNADVALMQKRDFYFGPPPDKADKPPASEALERIIWKGDLATLLMVKGSTLIKVLQDSAQFDAQDSQTLSLELMKDRGLVPLGISHDTLRNQYLINGELLDPNRLYSVATTDYIGLGDTGYPEIVESGFDNPQVVNDFPKKLSRISSLVCREIGAANCQAPFTSANDLDELSTTPLGGGPALTGWGQFWHWTQIPYLFHPGSHPQEPRDQLKSNPVELSVQDRRVWFISNSEAVSFSAVDNNVSVAQQKAEFSAINNPSQLQAKQSHDFSVNLKDSTGFKGRQIDFYFQPEIDFENVVTAQAVPPALSNIKQNGLDGELGFFLHRARNYPGVGMVVSLRDEAQLIRPEETVTLSDAQKSSLSFSHGRTNWLFGHTGYRVQNRKSYFEGGFELGDARRVTAFNFTGPAGSPSCPFASAPADQDEPACVAAHSSGANPSITKQSVGSAALGSAFRYGWYSTMKLVVPIQSRLSYVFTNTFDYFYAGNNSISTDMLFRDLWSNSFSITVTRNISVAPKFDVLFYENQVERNFFRQVQTSISLKYAFDWYSGSRWKTAVRYTEPQQQ